MTDPVKTAAAVRYLPLIPIDRRRADVEPPKAAGYRADAVGLSAAAQSAGAVDPALQAALAAAARRWGLDDAGVVLTDLATGRSAGLNAGKVFSSASVIKLAVMAEVFHQVQQGRLSLDQQVTVRSQDYTDTWHPDHDSRPYLAPGRQAGVGRLLELMITRSDNVATNTLAELVGRRQLNAYLQSLGAGSTQFHHKLSGGSIPVNDPGYDGGRNQTTARDMARLLTLIDRGRLVSPEASARMLAILKGQLDDSKIPAGLKGQGATVYHKTGETSHVTHDVAIVEEHGRRYVLTILTNRGPGDDTYRRMAGLTRDLNAALQ